MRNMKNYYDNNSQYDPARLTSFIQFLEGLHFAYYLRGHDDFKLTKEDILNKLKQKYSLITNVEMEI